MDEPEVGTLDVPRNEGSRRRRFRWKAWLIGLALVIAVPGVALGIFSVGSIVQVSRAQASVRAAGFAMRLVDLERPPVPEEQNAARIYSEAMGYDPDPKGSCEALRGAMDLGFSSLKDTEKERVRSLLKTAAPIFEILRRARSRAQSRYEAGYIQYPLRFSQFRETGELLALQVESERDGGRVESALETLRDLFALAESHREEPFLVSQGVRLALVRLGLRTVNRCVTVDASEGELRGWLEQVPLPESFDGTFAKWVRTEIALASEWSGMDIRQALGSLG